MDETRRAFYEYHAAIMEPWDGPAAIAFTDGRQIGATLDRNGLRRRAYLVTSDDRHRDGVRMGVLENTRRTHSSPSGGCSPARCCWSTSNRAGVIPDDEIQGTAGKSHPYREWLDRTQIVLEELPDAPTKGHPLQPAAPGSAAGVRL